MENILWFLLGYLLLLTIWLVFVLLFFALSFVFRKNLSLVPSGLTYLISYGIQLFLFGYAVYMFWQIIVSHQWLLLIFALIFGGFILSIWQMMYNLFLTPFIALSLYFSNKVDKTDFNDDAIEAEILDKDNKVIDVSVGSSRINKKLATIFLINYIVNLIYIITHPQQYHMLGWWDYMITPIFFMVQNIIIFGIVIGIYNKIKHHKFIWRGKKQFLIQTFIADLIFTIGIQVLAIIYLLILARS